MNITEKVAYIKGLVDGMEFEGNTPEKKLLLGIVDLLDQMAQEVSDIRGEVETLGDLTEELDHDLGELEEFVYDECEGGCDCGCDDDEYEYDDDEDGYAFECPECGKTISFCDCDDPSDIVCPHCGESIDCEEFFSPDDDDEIFEIEDAPDEK